MTATTSKASTVTDADTGSTALATFKTHPAVTLTSQALAATGNGLKTVWAHEREFQTGLMFVTFLKEAFTAIALPILSLIWLAITTAYTTARKPETKAYIVARYESAKAWFQPKFSDEYSDTEQLEIS